MQVAGGGNVPVSVLQRIGNRLTLRLRLVLALLVPVLGMSVFTGLWSWQRLQDANRAGAAREQAELLVRGTRLYNAVNFDRAIVGLIVEGGGIRALGAFRPVALGQVLGAQRDIYVRANELLATPVDAGASRATLERVDAAMAALRSGPAGKSGGEINDAMGRPALLALDSVRALLGEELNGLRAKGGPDTLGETASLVSLADLRSIALREASIFVLNAQFPGRHSRQVLQEIAATTSAGQLLTANQLSPEHRRQLLAYDDSDAGKRYHELRERVERGEVVPFLPYIPAMQRRIELISTIQDKVGADVLGRVGATEHDARRAFVLAVWSAAGLVLVSLLLGVLALRPTTRTLRRLAGQARRIGAGDLNVEPLAVRGRDEAAVLATSFDEMSGTLRTLQFQLDALAEGRGDDPALQERVPGHIGEAMARSVAHLSAMTSQLRSSEETARLTIDTAIEAIWTLDVDGRILAANSATRDLTCRPVDGTLGRQIEDLLGPNWLQRGIDGAIITMTDREVTVHHPDGAVVELLVSTRRVSAADGTPRIMLFARDISERKRLEDRLAWEASHDALTGLPNRVALLRDLSELASRSSGDDVAVMFIDLDRFKRVNDGLGHRVGDELLRQVADRLRANLRDRDVLARLGGDEFVVVRATDGTPADADRIAQRLIDAIERPFNVEGTVAHISASVGIVAAGPGDAADIIRRADLAMYSAKQSGRGRVIRYDESMQGAVRTRIELEEALRVAIAHDELRAAYQPIVATAGEHLAGVELLARWTRPDGTAVSPAEFIPIAEDTGIVIEIGRWALREAARMAVALRAEIPTFHAAIAVNISGVHLVHGALVDDVREVLAATGADPQWLRIEITESYLLEEALDSVDHALRELVKLGVALSVDDFGTGYSSLTYLRRIPADIVKIDRSYVARLESDPSELAIIGLVATLAHSLGMRVVAEGVETRAQQLLLAGAGCEFAQGFLFARPMDADDFTAWALAYADAPPEQSPWSPVTD